MREEIDRVIGKLNSLLQGDGSRLVLVESSGSSITLRFEKRQSAECESCAIDSDAVEMLVQHALANALPSISEMKFISGSSTSTEGRD